MFLQKILHDKFVGLRLLAILFIAAGLALTGCDESGGGGGGFSDKRSDADLVDVMAAALAEALAAGETGYNTLTTVDETSGQAVGSAIESQAGSAAATGLAGAALTAGLQMDGLSGTSAESSEMIRHRVEMEVLRALAAAPMDGSGNQALTVDTTFTCVVGGGTVSGKVTVQGDQTSGTFKYDLTVDFDACSDGTYTIYGEIVYAGSIEITISSDESADFDTDVTVNGGIAMDNTTDFYNFIIRDTLDFDGSIDAAGNGSFVFALSLRVDDGTTNVQCSVEGTFDSFFVDITTASNCTASTSTLL